MASHPLTPEHERMHPGEDFAFLLDTPGNAGSWQAGLDEIDAFYASCRTTPRQSANQQAEQRDLCSMDIDHIQGHEKSFLPGASIVSAAQAGYQECGADAVSKMQRPIATEQRSSSPQTLLQPSHRTIDSSLTDLAPCSAETALGLPSLPVQADSTPQPSALPSFATAATLDSNPVLGYDFDSGSPMELDIPRPEAGDAQTHLTACNHDALSSISSKSSLIDEMGEEDLQAASDTLETKPASKPPFGREIARSSDASHDLLNHHCNPDLPRGVAKRGMQPPLKWPTRLLSPFEDRRRKGSLVVQLPVPQRRNGKNTRVEEPNLDEGCLTRNGDESATEINVVWPLEVANERQAYDVDIQPPKNLKGRGKSTLFKELEALRNSSQPSEASDRRRSLRCVRTVSIEKDILAHPNHANERQAGNVNIKAPETRKRGKSTLVKELEALRTPGMLPDQSSSSRTGSSGVERGISNKIPNRRGSSPKTRAQHEAEPSGAATAKKRHAKKA